MYRFCGENLYKLDDLMKALNHHNGDLQLFDTLLTAFYIQNGKGYEFLGDDLNITLVKEKNFNDHLLKLTHKSSIEEISPDIIERQKNCYLEYTIENDKIPKSVIEKYIFYIYNLPYFEEYVEKYFTTYSKENFYFAIYGGYTIPQKPNTDLQKQVTLIK